MKVVSAGYNRQADVVRRAAVIAEARQEYAPVDAGLVVPNHSELSTIYTALCNAGASSLYPGFESWFFDKVVPSTLTGERKVFSIMCGRGSMAGIAICKRNQVERKLCTLWVAPGMRRRGLGNLLACVAFDWLETPTPLFTVPEEMINNFENLVNNWGFGLPLSCHNLYRPSKIEYLFNLETVRHAH